MGKVERKKSLNCTSGLQIIDVSIPSNPKLVSGIKLNGTYAKSLAVSGNYAYVTDCDSGLQIINITLPTHPTLIASYKMADGGCPVAVAVSGCYVYIGEGDSGLQVINVTTPSKPALVSSYKVPNSGAVDVALSGKFAYVAGGYKAYPPLQIFNIATPSRPKLMNTTVFSDNVYQVIILNNYAYLIRLSSLEIYKMTTPTQLTYTGFIGIPSSGEVKEVTVSNNYAYAAASFSGLQVIDVTNSSDPKVVGSLDTDGANSITVSGKYVYVANYNRELQVVNVEIPTHPKLEGEINIPLWTNVKDVAIHRNYAYVVGDCNEMLISKRNPIKAGKARRSNNEAAKTVSISTSKTRSDYQTIVSQRISPLESKITNIDSNPSYTPSPNDDHILLEATQTSGASQLRGSFISAYYDFLLTKIDGLLERISNSIGTYATQVTQECPSYFPPDTPNYWSANIRGTMFSASDSTTVSNATLIAVSQNPGLLSH